MALLFLLSNGAFEKIQSSLLRFEHVLKNKRRWMVFCKMNAKFLNVGNIEND
jgi:hypothetical protein